MDEADINPSLSLLQFFPMEPGKCCIKLFAFVACISLSSTAFFILSDARHVVQFSNFEGSKVGKTSIHKPMKKPKLSIHQKLHVSIAESNSLSTPFSMPPSELISPLSSPPNFPAPLCVYPPFPPNFPPPGPPHPTASPPAISPGPNPSQYTPSPPNNYGVPISPHFGPSASPPKPVPSTPIYQVPPRAGHPPPPPNKKPEHAVWCVAKPTVPDTIIQEAMDYACGTGADCKSIQPKGPCFQPNTLYAHASYAFNSYWQRAKVGGGTCDFGGTAMLVTVDPSFDKCDFIYN